MSDSDRLGATDAAPGEPPEPLPPGAVPPPLRDHAGAPLLREPDPYGGEPDPYDAAPDGYDAEPESLPPAASESLPPAASESLPPAASEPILPQPAPEPSPWPAPEPSPQSEPAPEPEPEPSPQPTPEPEPVVPPEPFGEPEPVVPPEPLGEPVPEAGPVTEPAEAGEAEAAAPVGPPDRRARRHRRRQRRRRAGRHAARKQSEGSFLRELPVLLLIAFVLALLIKTFALQAFFIPSGSMEQTLQVRDRVLVNKLVYKFRHVNRGEIVVFNGLDSFTPEIRVPPPANGFEAFRRRLSDLLGLGQPGERDFIKRVIGLPGDTVACCTDGKVTVNGVPLDEPYLFENDQRAFGPVEVPPGKVWVMGDHRSRSSDSRTNNVSVPIDRIIGRAFVVVWPPEHFTGLPIPGEFERADIPERHSLPAPAGVLALTPPVLGLAGAVPIAAWRRRRRQRNHAFQA